MKQWRHRLPGPRGLHEMREGAQDMEQQAKRPPPNPESRLEKSARLIFLATAGISVALGAVHLYKALFPKNADRRPNHSYPPEDPPPEDEDFDQHRRHAHRHPRNRAYPSHER